jgi:hypothetical protein
MPPRFDDDEFHLPPSEKDKETVLILAGDIDIGNAAMMLIRKWCERFRAVIYIAGNHEFYGHIYEDLIRLLKNYNNEIDNFFFLEKESVEIDDVSFFGATFWTPVDVENESDLYFIRHALNDYNHIRYIHPDVGAMTHMTPSAGRKWFYETVIKYNEWIQNSWGGKRVIISHHAPSEESSAPQFKGTRLQPVYFYDALEHLIGLESITLLVHGHMHNTADYYLKDNDGKDVGPLVLANPFGYYRHEENPNYNPKMVIQI